MAEEPNSSRDPQNSGWLQHVWVPIITALIVAAAAIIAAIIGGSTFNQSDTTTVVGTVATPDSKPSDSEPQPQSQASERVPCLPSRASGDAEDNSMDAPRGPLESGRLYRGTLINGDEEWWGFCAARSGGVKIKVSNVCEVQGSGATNLVAEVFDPSGEEIVTLRPDPGHSQLLPLQVEASAPYYVHIFDLGDVDIGGVCSEVPWTLVVTGNLTTELST